MERKLPRSAVVLLAAIVGLLLAYPASVGPAAFLVAFIDWDSLNHPVLVGFDRLYSPLFHLPHPIGDWMIEWENYGLDFGNYMRGR